MRTSDTSSPPEGLATLRVLEGAPNYNAWLGGKIRPWLGPRVLEVGAGIGTITAELQEGRELMIALEVEPAYVAELRERFARHPHVRIVATGAEDTDWPALEREGLDSIVLSNVLEHIEDDGAALRTFRRTLRPGGRVVLVVPALQALFGSLDEAVGHHRRYSRSQLREVLERSGFRIVALEWLNAVGIAGWFLNGRILRRRALPRLQVQLYDRLAPWLAAMESKVRLPVGLSLFAVAAVDGENR